MRKKILTVITVLLICQSILAGNKACFSHFTYIGNDDNYKENTLRNDGDYFNPVISGWASDPSICRVRDDYWLVTSTFGYFPGVPIYHSRDLVSWRHVGNVLSRPSQLPWLEGLSIDKGGIYAPDLKYNPNDGTYYMITTCVMNGKDGSTLNFYVTTNDPLGEWSDPVVLPDIVGIDPSFFFDEDGRSYIVYKSDEHSTVKWSNHRALSIIEFDTKSGKTIGNPVKFNEEGVGPEERLERDEGPHIYKINGKYYLIAAEGGTNWVHSEVCYQADSVFGPYRRWSRNPMLTQRLLKPNRKLPVTSSGHADLVQTSNGEWWAVFLGCRPWNDGEDHLGRETFLMPVKWSKDGFPYITQAIDTVCIIGNMPGMDGTQNSSQAGNFVWKDDFDGPDPCCEWFGLWGDPWKYCHLNKGLYLECVPIDTKSGKTPAYIGRRMQHHKFTAETEIDFLPEEKESAGLLLFKNENRQYFLAVQKERVALYRFGKNKDNALIASAPLKKHGEKVGLKAVSTGKAYDFFYRESSGEWKCLAKDVRSDHIATQRGGFTGSTIGLYATSVEL